jgi:ABC-type transport system substrate-binding protein
MVSLLPPALAGERDPSYPPFDADAGAAALRDNGFSRFHRIEGAWQTTRATYGDEYLAAVEALTRTLSRNPAVRIARVDAEPETFFDQLQRGTAPAQFVGWGSLVPHPDAYLTPLLSSAGAIAQAAGYSNPEVDRLLREAALASPDEAQALYAEVQEIALEDIVVVPLWATDFVVLARESVDAESIVISPNLRLHLDLLRRAD